MTPVRRRPEPRVWALVPAVLAALGLWAVTPGALAADSAPGADAEATAPGSTGGTSVVGAPVDLVGEPVDLFGEVASIYGELDGLTVVDGPDGTEVRTAADVLFAFDSAELSDEARAVLDEAAQVLAVAGPDEVVVEGHTDGIGTPEYNDRLSRQRAEAVAGFLADHAELGDVTFRPVGRGADDPIAAEVDDRGEDLPEGRARNRRVTLLFEARPS